MCTFQNLFISPSRGDEHNDNSLSMKDLSRVKLRCVVRMLANFIIYTRINLLKKLRGFLLYLHIEEVETSLYVGDCHLHLKIILFNEINVIDDEMGT